MKKVLVFILCLSVLIMFSMGCAKKKEEVKPAEEKEVVEEKEAVPETVEVAEPETLKAEE